MNIIDVFNGDADGICALLQLRHATPCQSTLVTGIKRDINLLKKVTAESSDQINVLDVSLDKNREDLIRNLNNGAQIFYVDHHFCGEIPQHKNLTTSINTDPNICTSLLVNQHLQSLENKSEYPLWAITGAFGDNLNTSAQELANQCHVNNKQSWELQKLGIMINYNGYGATIDDLHFAPDTLFRNMLPYKNPLDFIYDSNSCYSDLKKGYEEDNNNARSMKAEVEQDNIAVFILPDETWARRISGVYGNELANLSPDRAHAVLTHNKQGGYTISVRAPLNNKTGADELCRMFETGGGRKAAAGINHLEKNDLDKFVTLFAQKFK